VRFIFLHPVLGCMGLFGMQFIATDRNLQLANSFVYPLLVGAAKNCIICSFELAAKMQHFGTLDFSV
jgi:hypothetical protein